MKRFSIIAMVLLAAAPLAAAEKPNIIFIMADDMGQGDLGCYNPASKVPTPNMDRLAAEGIRFNDAHTPSSVCTPTRYGVLTGRYSWRSRLKSGVLWGFSRSLIEPGRLTVPALLKQHGYATAGVGKWHLGFQDDVPGMAERQKPKVDYDKPLRPGPVTVGFDYFFGIPASLDMDPYVFVRNDRPIEPPSATVERSEHRRKGGGGFWRAGPMAPSFRHIDVLPRITQEAVGVIERHAANAKQQPFFLYFPLSAPHTPWLPTDEFRGKSDAGYYGDFTVQVDWSIGQVMAALDRLGLKDDTLIIVTSDNGSHWTPEDIEQFGHEANNSRRGQKADAWEGGHRVPFVARWPGRIRPNTSTDQTICLTDLMATCAAIVGADVPRDAGEDSFNILPALLGKDGGKPIRPATVHHSIDGTFAIRAGDWKLIEGLGSHGFSSPKNIKPEPGGPTGQLYNLASDPAEQTNLYLQKPEKVRELTAILDAIRESDRSRP